MGDAARSRFCETCGLSIWQHWIRGHIAYCDPPPGPRRRRSSFTRSEVNACRAAVGRRPVREPVAADPLVTEDADA